jgi:glucosamine-phosphate N-acetyltransferase
VCILAHIEDVCVKKEYRNMGLGKKIIEYCVERCRQIGAYKITLDCNETNIPFYKKCNFEQKEI